MRRAVRTPQEKILKILLSRPNFLFEFKRILVWISQRCWQSVIFPQKITVKKNHRTQNEYNQCPSDKAEQFTLKHPTEMGHTRQEYFRKWSLHCCSSFQLCCLKVHRGLLYYSCKTHLNSLIHNHFETHPSKSYFPGPCIMLEKEQTEENTANGLTHLSDGDVELIPCHMPMISLKADKIKTEIKTVR